VKARRDLIQIGLALLAFSTLNLQFSTAFAQPVTTIAAGGGHSLFLKSGGSLWDMGNNLDGQLGDGGQNQMTNRPEQIVASNVTAIAAGGSHSLFLKSDGSLWAMGANTTWISIDWNLSILAYTGQLGDGTYNDTNQPEQIVSSNVTAIAAGADHSLFLKSDCSLWAMGLNNYGQLGDGHSGTYIKNINALGTNSPEQIVASNVTAIAAGNSHSLFLKNDGSLWAMGWNVCGQLGDGTINNVSLPEQIVSSNVTAIASGDLHSLFLKSDGSLWAMGNNQSGQLGDGINKNVNLPEQIVASNVTAVAAGSQHSLFLKSDGSLWAMGDNELGELGDGSYASTNRPEQIVSSGVTAIAAGTFYSMFLKNDGSLWAMGRNFYGQLGDGTFNNTNRPEQILAAYNQIAGQPLSCGDMCLSFVGIANANYALDRSSSLSSPNWIPQATNAAGSFGALVFTNPPDATTNNYWRIRSVQ
jgi:alpha-tubulin suppressor-like RCC1 family protein